MSTVNNVLIFPAGSEIAFEINNALKYSKFCKVFGATSARDHSEFVYENLITGLPFINEPDFIDCFNTVIDEYKIDFIYPAYDEAQIILMENQDKIHAKIVSAPYETVKICRSKKLTYEYLSGEDFIPKTYESLSQVKEYPVFVKPARSQGSQGAKLIHEADELQRAISKDSSLVICEYLPGDEYTVDCFTDGKGNLLTAKVRIRERIRTGIAVRSKMLPYDGDIQRIAEIINKKFTFVGAWFFQVKKNIAGKYRLLEISPRIPGTMGLSRNCGINFPVLTLFVMNGFDVSVVDNAYNITLDRAFYSAYKIDIEYNVIYLDFDDTLIINDNVNVMLMAFLYQALSKQKQIILLSKHSTDMYVDLKKYHIDSGMFADIIVIPKNDEKSNYINRSDAIFIDDSFAERKKIHEQKHIPVFDVDMIESLLDWKI